MLSSPSTTDTQLYAMARRKHIPLRSVCFKDQLSLLEPTQGGYIINLSDSDQHGTHWVAIYLAKPGEAFYFDSFGIDPPIAVSEFCERYGCKNILTNHKQVQKINSGYCGQYCIDFLLFMTFTKGSYIARYYKFLNQFR